jgi:RHS repeat-associated protein
LNGGQRPQPEGAIERRPTAANYHPELPRFISPDPVGGKPAIPLSWNRYLYCRNDPINYFDPDGENPYELFRLQNLCKNLTFLVNPLGKQQHFDRNAMNQPAKDRNEADAGGHRKLPPEKSVFHMQGQEGKGNVKYVSEDGHHESVFNSEGELLTQDNDSKNMGTYNYFDPVDQEIMHVIYDVLPYFLFGNVEEDPTTAGERLKLTFTEVKIDETDNLE